MSVVYWVSWDNGRQRMRVQAANLEPFLAVLIENHITVFGINVATG